MDMTQEEFAEKAGFNLRYYRFIEQGVKDVSVSTLARLASTLGCRPSELLRPTKSPVRKPGRPKKRTSTSLARTRSR